jgi:exosortase family protein XrtM
MIPDEFLRNDVYFYGIVCPSRLLIHWLAPAEQVAGIENRIVSAGVQLSIVRGCDGSGVAFLLIGAICAARAALRRTVLGILGALALVYVLNQLRIVALFFIDGWRPSWFTPMHVYFIPTLMILLGTLYFALWSGPTAAPHEPPAAA